MIRIIFPTGVVISYSEADTWEKVAHGADLRAATIHVTRKSDHTVYAIIPLSTPCVIDHGGGEVRK